MFKSVVGPALALALLSGCPNPEEVEGPPPPPPVPPAVAIDNGDGQVGLAGVQLPEPLGVRVTNANGSVATTFEVVAGGGRLVPVAGGTVTAGGAKLTVNTVDGFASAGLVLGAAGGQRVKVTFSGMPNYLEFQATAHGPPTTVLMTAGDGQNGEVGTELPDRVSVKVTDASGIQVPGMRVWFVPQDNGQPLDGEVIETGRGGTAVMPSRWRLGPAVGPQRLVARVLAGSTGATDAALAGNPVTFSATATAAVARTVSRNPASFPVQTAAPGEAVAVRPSVVVLSGAGTPMPGVSVRFDITAGGGHFGGSVVVYQNVTNSAGIVTVPDWVLGTVGANTVTATVVAAGVAGSPVTFSANAVLPDANLLQNPSFEEPVTARVIPAAPGGWGGDLVESVPLPAGFPSVDGTRVLRFIATGPTASTNTVASELFQTVDVSRFSADIDAGKIRIDGEVLFGRVDAPNVDRLFGMQLLAFDGPPDQFAAKFAAQSWLGRVRVDRTVTAAAVWQNATGSLVLPAGTRYVAIHIFAYEDVVNDGVGVPEFAGHYAETASLRVRPVVP